MSFRKIIQRETRRRELADYRVARMAGLTQQTLQALLAGDHDLSARRLERIAMAIGLELRPAYRSNERRVS